MPATMAVQPVTEYGPGDVHATTEGYPVWDIGLHLAETLKPTEVSSCDSTTIYPLRLPGEVQIKGEQDVEPCAAYWPLEQLVHAVEASLSTSAVPAKQSSQAVASWAAYRPAEQLVHAVEGSLSSSAVPAAHCVQDVCPAAEWNPTEQAVQGVDELESKSAVPAAQSMHAVEPCAAYWPLEQLVQP